MNPEQLEGLWSDASASLAVFVDGLTNLGIDGTPFFDAVDAEMRDPKYFQALMTKGVDDFPEATHIVVSGRFGRVFADWLLHSEWNGRFPPALLVPGNLRHSEMPPLFAKRGFKRQEAGPFRADGWSKPELRSTEKFLFLDDSAYKFRTYNQIKQRLEEADAEVVGHVVLYDGSQEPKRIPSFFRWHPDEGMKQ